MKTKTFLAVGLMLAVALCASLMIMSGLDTTQHLAAGGHLPARVGRRQISHDSIRAGFDLTLGLDMNGIERGRRLCIGIQCGIGIVDRHRLPSSDAIIQSRPREQLLQRVFGSDHAADSGRLHVLDHI